MMESREPTTENRQRLNRRAVAFDLFDTLVRIKSLEPKIALMRLIDTLVEQGIAVEPEAFKPQYLAAIRRHMAEARRSGIETHNRFWICDALAACGMDILADDVRIKIAIDQYFATMDKNVVLLPGTREVLAALKEDYRLGLLSNFTHGPVVQVLLDHFELRDYFEVILVSGEIGYRKPHPQVFQQLVGQLQCDPGDIVFVGDNIEDDIQGAAAAGLQPVWTTIVKQLQGRFSPRLTDTQHLRPAAGVPEIRSWEELRALLR